jgi:hypothetical protein
MRGVAGARAIMNAVGGTTLERTANSLDPSAVSAINAMSAGKLQNRIRIAREIYDRAAYPQFYGGGAGGGAAKPQVDISRPAQPGAYTPGRGGAQVQNIIVHSSDGRESGDLSTLTTQRSAHYYVTRTGKIYQLLPEEDTAFHAGKVREPQFNNQHTVGIEQEHYDPGVDAPAQFRANGEDWPEAQVRATARLVSYLKSKYGLTNDNVHSHADVAPERKQDPYGYPWQDFFRYAGSGGGGQWPYGRGLISRFDRERQFYQSMAGR